MSLAVSEASVYVMSYVYIIDAYMMYTYDNTYTDASLTAAPNSQSPVDKKLVECG